MRTADRNAAVTRHRLAESGLGLIERLQVRGPRAAPPRDESYCAHFQICLPYRGALAWHVGGDHVVADPNQVIFVTGGESYRMSRPIDGGYSEIIVTVDPSLIAETLGVAERHVPAHVLFRRRSRLADRRLQWLGASCLHDSREEQWDGMASDAWLIEFMRSALAAPPRVAAASPSSLRALARAKEYLSANLGAPVRLVHVARAARTSPAYLTTLFRCLEGLPLHQYLVRLRLARSLAELPHAPDIARLSGDLGFSTHSHFTAAFRRTYGCTPSTYRDARRRDQASVRTRAKAIERSRQRLA